MFLLFLRLKRCYEIGTSHYGIGRKGLQDWENAATKLGQLLQIWEIVRICALDMLTFTSNCAPIQSLTVLGYR